MNIPLNIDWQQILLHLFNFVVLFAVLYFLLYNPVKKFMEKRTEYYKGIEDEAKAKLEASETAKKEYLSKLDAVEEEIADIKEKARKKLEESNALKVKQAEEEAAKIIEEARETLEKERAKMIKETQNEISDMVADAAEKLIINSTTSDAYDQFLNAAKGSDSDE